MGSDNLVVLLLDLSSYIDENGDLFQQDNQPLIGDLVHHYDCCGAISFVGHYATALEDFDGHPSYTMACCLAKIY